MKSKLETAKYIVEHGDCGFELCFTCPAHGKTHKTHPRNYKCTFCMCFATNESAIKFFKKYIKDNESAR